LSNLQNVLEQFQSDQQVLIEEKLSGLRKEVSSLKSELATSQNVIASLKVIIEMRSIVDIIQECGREMYGSREHRPFSSRRNLTEDTKLHQTTRRR
jgi:predicted glycosyltransferase